MARRGTGWLLAGTAAVAYTYAGYPLLVRAAASSRRRTDRTAAPARDLPDLTVIVAALDEEAVIAAKIDDIRNQDYPADRLCVMVVADGSTDGTVAIARHRGAEVLWRPERQGKSAAVNRAVEAATTDVVVLTDANCSLAPGALRALVAELDDPRVAVVSGAKSVAGDGARGGGEGLYWRIESEVKKAESALGSTVGAPGELLALRRSAFRPVPEGIINDDYHLTCDALAQGLRVAYAPGAVAHETVSPRVADEFERRTRIAAGTWQTTLSHLALGHPRRGWLALSFVSHRVLRSLVVPLLLPVLWVGSMLLSRRSRLAALLATGQTAAYGAAALGAFRDEKLLSIPFQFALTNLATVRGAWRLLTRRQPVAWRRIERSGWA